MAQEMIGGNGGLYHPVKTGEEVTVVIVKLGEKGDGIAKLGNFVIIVPGTMVGQRAKVQITKVIKTCAFAKVI